MKLGFYEGYTLFGGALHLGRPKGAGSWILYFGTQQVNPPTGVPIAQIQGGLNFEGRSHAAVPAQHVWLQLHERPLGRLG
jgi:hypothetical protein